MEHRVRVRKRRDEFWANKSDCLKNRETSERYVLAVRQHCSIVSLDKSRVSRDSIR